MADRKARAVLTACPARTGVVRGIKTVSARDNFFDVARPWYRPAGIWLSEYNITCIWQEMSHNAVLRDGLHGGCWLSISSDTAVLADGDHLERFLLSEQAISLESPKSTKSAYVTTVTLGSHAVSMRYGKAFGQRRHD